MLFGKRSNMEFLQLIPPKHQIAFPVKLVIPMIFNDYTDCIFNVSISYKYTNIFGCNKSESVKYKFKLNKELNDSIENAVLYC